MKKYCLTAFIALAALSVPAAAGDTHVFGTWLTKAGGHVRIVDCGDGTPCGTITQVAPGEDPDKKDDQNEDESLRNRKIVGLQMLSGFRAKKDRWVDGKVYDPASGGTYSGQIWLTGDGQMKLKGCIVWPACKTQEWTRIAD